MRLALLAVLSGAAALAAPRSPVVAFLPPSSPDASLQQLALLLEARASELVEETSKVNQLHLKQTLRAMQEEGFTGDLADPKNADSLRQAIGADSAVAFSLVAAGDGLTLSGVWVDGKKPKPFSTKLPKGWSAALEAGGPALAKALVPGLVLPK